MAEHYQYGSKMYKDKNLADFMLLHFVFLDLGYLSCDKDQFNTGHSWIFNFKIKLWDTQAGEAVRNELRAKNVSAETTDIFIYQCNEFELVLIVPQQ
uniref:Uncharacterized protein n=1 Tax=Panagrolaimus superbus TaxID=310955 RepID=A0A914YAW1_9BILA